MIAKAARFFRMLRYRFKSLLQFTGMRIPRTVTDSLSLSQQAATMGEGDNALR